MAQFTQLNDLKPTTVDSEEFLTETTEESAAFSAVQVTKFVQTVNTTERVLKAADELPDGDSSYILIPLIALFTILVLSAMVFLMARNRRRLVQKYCRRTHLTNEFDDDSESGLEPNDYDDLDDPSKCLLKGKLHIDNRREHYRTSLMAQSIAEENGIFA